MTSLPASQTVFLSTSEEPEKNRISFRDSLKFFQEQLVINGANLPSPSPITLPGTETLRKGGSLPYKENVFDNCKVSGDTEENIQSERCCKITIPTVETILESVRVLRAIQKSQEARGSTWDLDITTKQNFDIDFNYTVDSDENPKIYHNDNTDKELIEVNNVAVLVEDRVSNTQISPVIKCIKEEISQSNDGLQNEKVIPNNVNEICSFWPSNKLINNDLLSIHNTIPEITSNSEIKEKGIEESQKHAEDLNTPKATTKSDISFCEKESNHEIPEFSEQNNLFESSTLENCTENNHDATQSRNTPDSLRAACTDLLNYMNSNGADKSKNNIMKEPNATTERLKIETYDGIETQKSGDFFLSEPLWKGSCSENENSIIKIEQHNDSDSGIGTQRSGSSLSPNNPSQMQKDSWSDTCSSHYASAECSPYHSLNSVFESSLGSCVTPGDTKALEDTEILSGLTNNKKEDILERVQDHGKEASDEQDHGMESSDEQDHAKQSSDVPVHGKESSDVQDYGKVPSDEQDHGKVSSDEQGINLVSQQSHSNDLIPETNLTDICNPIRDFDYHSENAELDTEISYCNFVTNYTIENPCERTENNFEITEPSDKICVKDEKEIKFVNDPEITLSEQSSDTISEPILSSLNTTEIELDERCDLDRIQKFTAASCDLVSIVQSLYKIKENPAFQVLPLSEAQEDKFEETVFVLSKGAFSEYPEDNYLAIIEDSVLHITKDSQVLQSLNMKYEEVSITSSTVLKVDNRVGRCVYIQCDRENLMNLKSKIEQHCLKHWQADCLQLVHYPLKCHQNVIIVDLGSCSTRAGIVMDQPTLPRLFFPTLCATDRRTGKSVYGMEALQSEVRQHSNLSFPVRPTIKITKHTIDIESLGGFFKKIFCDLNVDPTQYTVQVCLPRNLSISAQTALVKLLLEDLNVKAVSLTSQALLTLYAHEVSTAVVVDIGDRTDVLPVVDGFIVENGVTRLPHGGQRLIHHMKHGLAEKRLSLSNDIDSFVVQYVVENLAYIAEDYEKEVEIALQNPDIVRKTVTLQPASPESKMNKTITLEEARFKIPEGLFNPELWGLDSPGIHHLVQKAIQATSVDARKQIAENIYVSGGVTMLPGFVERLNKEVAKLSKTKIVPKVYASNYRYHCTYIGACKFAKMDVFPQVCVNLQEYSTNGASALKKCALYF